jgi:hypothetical protein
MFYVMNAQFHYLKILQIYLFYNNDFYYFILGMILMCELQ